LRLASQIEGLLYSADDYSDDLPFWDRRYDRPLLIVPYALDTNDMRFSAAHGFAHGEHFYQYLKDAFDTLFEEGRERPAMMSVGLHCRLVGRPGRFAGLRRFVEHIAGHPDIWVCRRSDIARHWHEHHPLERVAS
jgi:peptidoglycan/xylan/chitin deacetylase (PgdA/CDA1 family)